MTRYGDILGISCASHVTVVKRKFIFNKRSDITGLVLRGNKFTGSARLSALKKNQHLFELFTDVEVVQGSRGRSRETGCRLQAGQNRV